MTPPASRAVLITGCSTGIGRATAERLADAGWPVFASARRPEAISDLGARGCHVLSLDVCDETSIRSAVRTVEEVAGAVGVLINNAGYGLEGAIEELSPEDVRAQFETNVFGPLRLTQLVLGKMRGQGWGKVVNVSSVGGRVTIPGGGAYHASKHAIEALSDALRFEVRPFGIDVIVIEPGAIESRWTEKSVSGIHARSAPGGPYAVFDRAVARRLQSAHEGLLSLAARPPEAVAAVIQGAIEASRPKSRYVVPSVARLFTGSRRVLPDRAWDALMRLALPEPVAAPAGK